MREVMREERGSAMVTASSLILGGALRLTQVMGRGSVMQGLIFTERMGSVRRSSFSSTGACEWRFKPDQTQWKQVKSRDLFIDLPLTTVSGET